MNRAEIVGMMGAYGFVVAFENLKEYRTRFRKEEGGGFIDVWQGRKGMTVGVYKAETKRMWYSKWVNASTQAK